MLTFSKDLFTVLVRIINDSCCNKQLLKNFKGLKQVISWSHVMEFSLTAFFQVQLTLEHEFELTGSFICRFFPNKYIQYHGLPWWLSGKESACKAGATGDVGLIPGSRRSPGGGHGKPLQYSCLENPMDRRVWWTTVHRVEKSWTRLKRLSMLTQYYNDLRLVEPMDS